MISDKAKIGNNVIIKDGVIIGDNVEIGDHCYLDYNVIIRDNVKIEAESFIGANSILGEYLSDFFDDYKCKRHFLRIGKNAIIRSGSILYGGCEIGDFFTSGHRITVREGASIGNHVSVGTLSDIQGNCKIGDYVRLHSNVHIGMKTEIRNYVWVFPYVVFTNDPTPPSENLIGTIVDEFAVVCTGTTVLPGLYIGKDALIGAGTTLTKNVPEYSVVIGNPGRVIGNVEKIKDKEGRQVYPWRNTFERGMPWQGQTFDEWEKAKRSRK